MIKKRLFTLLVLLSSSPAWSLGLELSTGYNSNLVRTDDVEPDQTGIEARFVSYDNYFFQFSSRTGMDIGWFAGYAQSGVTSLNHIDLGATAAFYFQPALGYAKPWYSAELTAQQTLNNNDQHNRIEIIVSVNRQQRLNDRFSLMIGGDYLLSLAAEDTYDLYRYELRGALDFLLTRRTLFYSQVQFEAGHFVSSYHAENNAESASYASRGHHLEGEEGYAISFQDSGLTEDFGEVWYTYQNDATRIGGMVGVNQAVNRFISIDAITRLNRVFNEEVSYDQWVVQAGLIATF